MSACGCTPPACSWPCLPSTACLAFCGASWARGRLFRLPRDLPLHGEWRLAMLEAAAQYRASGWWRDQTFLDDLRRHARDMPGRTAVIAYRVQEGSSSEIDYAELARLTGGFAAGLLSLGVKRGDTVAVQLPSRLETLPIGLACAQVGARFCPLLTIYRRYEMAHMRRLTGARV